KRRGDPTIELATEDLIMALRPGEDPAPPPPSDEPRPLPGVRSYGQPPPPPPRPPQIRPGGGLRTGGRTGSASQRRPSTPPPSPPRPRALPVRAYASAWDEFATAYEILPAPDT